MVTMRSLAAAGFAAGGLAVAYANTRHGELYAWSRPIILLTDPELGHRLGVEVSARPWAVRLLGFADVDGDPPSLASCALGRTFRNPVGLAAGYDKHAESMEGLSVMGFGFVEVGSVTPQPQPGNARPRVFRLFEDRAVINRYGFNSEGIAGVAPRLAAWRAARDAATPPFPPGLDCLVGVNLGKNKTSADAAADYAEGVKALGPMADYLVVNVSSPNTPGLRNLQRREELDALIGAVLAARAALPQGQRPPVLIKIAPDLDDAALRDIAAVAKERSIDGLIVSNTMTGRPASLTSPHRAEEGGLSGAPLLEPSTAVLRRVYELTEGKITLIGVGGIATGEDAYSKIRAGASLVQLYTSLALDGPGVVPKIKRELAAALARDGYRSVADAVGADTRGRPA